MLGHNVVLAPESVPTDLLGFFESAGCGACYVCQMVEVFREVRRVLRPDGTCWLNLGDSYCASPPGNTTKGVSAKSGLHGVNGASGRYRETLEAGHKTKRDTSRLEGHKPKDLIGVPWAVARALRDDGWYLRSDIIWSKKTPMPESVTDRPTRSHEYIFLLTKRAKYFYDADAVREPHTAPMRKPGGFTPEKAVGPASRSGHSQWEKQRTSDESYHPAGRNQRSVWHLGPEPYPDAHFATFPTEIPRRAILAGTSAKGCCRACGAPWRRVVETKRGPEPADRGGKNYGLNAQGTSPSSALRKVGGGDWYAYAGSTRTTGWTATCACSKENTAPNDGAVCGPAGNAAGGVVNKIPLDPIPCTVLDPFAGSGTTGLVADRLGRDSILIELNPTYAEQIRRRITGDAPMFALVSDG